MGFLSAIPLNLLADTTSYSFAHSVMQSFVIPVVGTLCALASLACTFFLVMGGYHYMTSTGKPDSLEHAKKIIRNALIGLVIVLSAVVLTAILSHTYGTPGASVASKMPAMVSIQPQKTSSGLTEVLINAISGLLQNIIESIADPFMKALSYFTSGTPLMASNGSVFDLWLAIVGITSVWADLLAV
jgi:hypothetical protein